MPGAQDREPCVLSTYSELDTGLSPVHGKEHVAFEAITFLSSLKVRWGRGEWWWNLLSPINGVVLAVQSKDT